MAKYKGRLFLVKRGQGDGPPETFTTVGGMRSTGMTINNETVDVTDKGSAPWRELLAGAGLKSMSISLAGVFKNDAELKALQQRILATDGTDILNFQIISESGDKFVGAFQITSLERTGEHVGEEQYSISLESSGAITFTPGF